MQQSRENTMNLDTRKNRVRCQAVFEVVNELQDFLPVTLRQIHYRLFSRNAEWCNKENATYQNTPGEYQGLSRLLTAMRAQGLVAWNVMEDTTRIIGNVRGVWSLETNIQQAEIWLDPCGYERNLSQSQPRYLEVWTEKQTLFRMLQSVADEFCVRVVSCRGFSSTTMIHGFVERAREALRRGQEPLVLFFSDFDPSGTAMMGAVHRKLQAEHGFSAEFVRPALTREQVDEHELPHNPDALKAEDPRAKAFLEKNGALSVELDALHPETLQEIVRQAIREHTDEDLMDEEQEREAEDRHRLQQVSNLFREAMKQEGEP